MTPTFVQRATGQTDGSSANTTSAAFTNTAGNAIIVGVMNDSTTAVTSVTDLAGNTYHKVVGKIVGGEAAIWVAYNIVAHTNNTVSFANGSNDGAIWAEEWSGLLTTNPVDQTATGTGTQTTGSITLGTTPATTQAEELVWALCALDYNSGQTLTAGSGYSNTAQMNFTGGGTSYFIWGMNESKVVSSTGAQAPAMTISNSGAFTWRATVATFKAAPSGPATPTNLFFF
jgi:hypothetical protein